MATLGLPSCTRPPQLAPAHSSRRLDVFLINKYFSRQLVEPKYVIHLFGARLLCSVLLFFPCKMCSLPKEECSLSSTMALRYAETFYSHWLSHTQSQNSRLFLNAKPESDSVSQRGTLHHHPPRRLQELGWWCRNLGFPGVVLPSMVHKRHIFPLPVQLSYCCKMWQLSRRFRSRLFLQHLKSLMQCL